MNTRYPGIRPFEQKDRSVFFGRDTDIAQLSRLIRLEKFVVLNGKSGLGKSSLLNAGVIPELERGGYTVEAIRLGAFDPKGIAELNTPYQSLYTQIKGESSYLAEVHPEDSLWMAAKHRQLRKASGKALVLVLDQFEELFTWPPEAVKHFKRELAALVNRKMPQDLSRTLQELPQEHFTEEQWEEIYAPLRIKVVMAIRADRLSLLNQLTDVLPDILKEIYELSPLDREAARSAIVLPARQRGDFASPPFTYSESTLKEILDFLSDDFLGRVESFQLQLVCQYIEDYIVPKEENASQNFQVEAAQLPPLEDIFANYYERQIQGLGNSKDQENARRFIEEGLILEEEERRLSLFEGVIRRRYGISEELLQQLVASRLIRSEPLAEGGYAYELSHDTLVPPILEAKKERVRARERRRWAIGAVLGGLAIAGLAFFAIWVNGLRLDAEAAQREAEQSDSLAQVRLRQALYSDSIAQINLKRALYSDSVSGENLVRALYSDSVANRRAKDAEQARTETQLQLTALQESNRRRVTELMGRFPGLINELRFGEAADLVLQALDIGAAPEASLRAAGELMYFYTEAEKPDRVWPVWEAVQQMEEMASWEGWDSLVQLRRGMEEILPEDTLTLLTQKYYPLMLPISGATFEMGGGFDWLDDIIDSLEVTVSDFALGRTEITTSQYFLYSQAAGITMAPPPSWGYKGYNPVANVSWWEALAYANWLSEVQGLSPVYTFPAGHEDSVQANWEANGYRLPTEAEWEYAAGGGSLERIMGKRRYIYAGSDSLDLVGWYRSNALSRTQPVGQLQPNALGLYDMSGNVWEWCWDWYGEYEKGPLVDPHGPYIGQRRVLRGGGWNNDASSARVSDRSSNHPAHRNGFYGFRLARAYSEAP